MATSEPGHVTPAPSPAQKTPKLVRRSPTANLIVFSGTRSSGERTAIPTSRTSTTAVTAAAAARGVRPCDRPERDHDEYDLEPFEQYSLERDRERVPIHRRPCGTRHAGCLLALGSERRTLVVQRLVAAGAKNRLSQPLETEDQEERSDNEAQGVDREQAERGTEHCDDHTEDECGDSDADQRRAPTPHDSQSEDDRERLDSLHATGRNVVRKRKKSCVIGADRSGEAQRSRCANA